MPMAMAGLIRHFGSRSDQVAPPLDSFLLPSGCLDRAGTPRRRIDEQADAFGRHRFVQEPEHGAAGDVLAQRELVIAPSGHHDRQVGELCMQPLHQFGRLEARDRDVHEQHAGLGRDEQVSRVQRIVRPPDSLPAIERMLQDLEQGRVVGDDDHVRRGGARPAALRGMALAVRPGNCGRHRGHVAAPIHVLAPAQRASAGRIAYGAGPTRGLFDKFRRGRRDTRRVLANWPVNGLGKCCYFERLTAPLQLIDDRGRGLVADLPQRGGHPGDRGQYVKLDKCSEAGVCCSPPGAQGAGAGARSTSCQGRPDSSRGLLHER